MCRSFETEEMSIEFPSSFQSNSLWSIPDQPVCTASFQNINFWLSARTLPICFHYPTFVRAPNVFNSSRVFGKNILQRESCASPDYHHLHSSTTPPESWSSSIFATWSNPWKATMMPVLTTSRISHRGTIQTRRICPSCNYHPSNAWCWSGHFRGLD